MLHVNDTYYHYNIDANCNDTYFSDTDIPFFKVEG